MGTKYHLGVLGIAKSMSSARERDQSANGASLLAGPSLFSAESPSAGPARVNIRPSFLHVKCNAMSPAVACIPAMSIHHVSLKVLINFWSLQFSTSFSVPCMLPFQPFVVVRFLWLLLQLLRLAHTANFGDGSRSTVPILLSQQSRLPQQ